MCFLVFCLEYVGHMIGNMAQDMRVSTLVRLLPVNVVAGPLDINTDIDKDVIRYMGPYIL